MILKIMNTTVCVRWNKGKVVVIHILRDEELCSHEDHIDFYNEHGESFSEILLHKELKDVYAEVLRDAIEEYNKKQKRKDRKITVEEYMQSVENDTRGKRQTKKVNGKRVVNEEASRQGKQTSYEITVKVGNTERAKDENGRVIYDKNGHHIRPEELPRELQHQILKRYARSFQRENPNFHVVNICLHGDEGFYNRLGVWEYSEIHLHIEIVPFASGYRQGLAIQNSMNKAMKEMGFDTPDSYSLWAKKEQDRLEAITLDEYEKYCEAHPDYAEEHGKLVIHHPVADRTKEGDREKETFARDQELDECIAEAEYHKNRYQKLVEGNSKKIKEQESTIRANEKMIQEQEQAIASSAKIKHETDEYCAKKRKAAEQEYDDAVVAYQMYDAEFEKLQEYEADIDNLKREVARKMSEIENMDLQKGFFH